jgi:hypothetical protein
MGLFKFQANQYELLDFLNYQAQILVYVKNGLLHHHEDIPKNAEICIKMYLAKTKARRDSVLKSIRILKLKKAKDDER